MNGKRAKQIRRLKGISIQARRDNAVFQRVIARAIDVRTDRRADGRRLKRQVIGWGGLAVIVAALLAGFFL